MDIWSIMVYPAKNLAYVTATAELVPNYWPGFRCSTYASAKLLKFSFTAILSSVSLMVGNEIRKQQTTLSHVNDESSENRIPGKNRNNGR